MLDYLVVAIHKKAVWKYVKVALGAQCVTMAGPQLMQELSADS